MSTYVNVAIITAVVFAFLLGYSLGAMSRD